MDKKGEEVVLLEVGHLVSYAERFLLATAHSPPHLDALQEAVLEAGRAVGIRPLGVEGSKRGSWILIDYGDVVVHLFSREGRGFYDLDGLWCDAPRTELTDDLPGASPARARA